MHAVEDHQIAEPPANVSHLRPVAAPAWEPPAPFDQGADEEHCSIPRPLALAIAGRLDRLRRYDGDELGAVGEIEQLRAAARSTS